jgi:hypothetical protein
MGNMFNDFFGCICGQPVRSTWYYWNYTPTLIKLIEWIVIITISQSVAFAGYMYLTAQYHRNLNSVPISLRNYWLGINLSFSTVHAVLSIIGTATGNLFWFGVDGVILVVQEVGLIVVLNISISKLCSYLQKMTQEKAVLGAVGTNFDGPLRKMMWVRVTSILITVFAAAFQLAAPGSAFDRISKPYTPIVLDNATFNILVVISPTLACTLHCWLFYLLRRPQPKSERSSEKNVTMKESSSSPGRPSVVTSTSEADKPIAINVAPL